MQATQASIARKRWLDCMNRKSVPKFDLYFCPLSLFWKQLELRFFALVLFYLEKIFDTHKKDNFLTKKSFTMTTPSSFFSRYWFDRPVTKYEQQLKRCQNFIHRHRQVKGRNISEVSNLVLKLSVQNNQTCWHMEFRKLLCFHTRKEKEVV